MLRANFRDFTWEILEILRVGKGKYRDCSLAAKIFVVVLWVVTT